MMRKCTSILGSLIITLALTSCQKEYKLGTQENPVKLYFTPSVDAETITKNSQDFLRFLEKETGLYFKSGIPTSYIAVVEAFGSKRADIGVINSFGYLMANKKYKAQALLKVLRYGHDYYQGQILAHVKANIKSIKDVKGRKFAYTDASSASGYMFPLKMLKEAQAEPGKTVFAQKHDNVVTMIYQRQVDAGATYYSAPGADGSLRDARSRVQTRFPDVADKVKIVAITEKIPNDPFVFREGLPQEIIDKFIGALKKYLNSEKGKQVFNDIYGVDGVVDATDKDYDGFRKMVEAVEIDSEKLL